MRKKLFSFIKNHPGSMQASLGIARMISSEIDAPIVTEEDVGEEPLDVLVIVNGAYAFSGKSVLEALGTAVREARIVVWVQNDYTIIPPKPDSGAMSPFRRAFVERRLGRKSDAMYWTTCEDWAKLPGSSYVNWNCLTFDEDAAGKNHPGGAEDLFYYGSFRENRRRYFDRYFASPGVPTTVSSPSKKFPENYPKITVVDKLPVGTLTEELARHGMGLYLEDRASHSHYHSPPNRFYEMLSAGIPILFQPECGGSLRRGGYDTTPWQASTSIQVRRALDSREKWGREQSETFLEKARAEKKRLPQDLRAVWKKMESEL